MVLPRVLERRGLSMRASAFTNSGLHLGMCGVAGLILLFGKHVTLYLPGRDVLLLLRTGSLWVAKQVKKSPPYSKFVKIPPKKFRASGSACGGL